MYFKFNVVHQKVQFVTLVLVEVLDFDFNHEYRVLGRFQSMLFHRHREVASGRYGM